jgi:hypothetical protein
MHPARRAVLVLTLLGAAVLSALPPWTFHLSRSEREPMQSTQFGASCYARRPPGWRAEVRRTGTIQGRPFELRSEFQELDAGRLVASYSWVLLLGALALSGVGPRRRARAGRQVATVAALGVVAFVILDQSFIWARERLEELPFGRFYRCAEVLDPTFDHRSRGGRAAGDAP